MRVMSFVLSIAALTLSSHAQAASEPQCSGDVALPLYRCINLEGAPDVRLYVQEFQNCENGKITEFSRTVNAFFFNPSGSESELEVANIKFSPTRSSVPDRGDSLTFIAPTAATLKSASDSFELTMTLEQAPDYNGAPSDQFHYLGKFKQIGKNGKLKLVGKLACSVD